MKKSDVKVLCAKDIMDAIDEAEMAALEEAEDLDIRVINKDTIDSIEDLPALNGNNTNPRLH